MARKRRGGISSYFENQIYSLFHSFLTPQDSGSCPCRLSVKGLPIFHLFSLLVDDPLMSSSNYFTWQFNTSTRAHLPPCEAAQLLEHEICNDILPLDFYLGQVLSYIKADFLPGVYTLSYFDMTFASPHTILNGVSGPLSTPVELTIATNTVCLNSLCYPLHSYKKIVTADSNPTVQNIGSQTLYLPEALSSKQNCCIFFCRKTVTCLIIK